MKNNPVNNFILGQKKNFDIAADVASAWAEVRQEIVLGFLDRLDSHLKKTLKGWNTEREQIFYEDPWASFNFWKPSWDKQYSFGLVWREHGKEITFGVCRDKNIGRRPHCEDLLKAVASETQLPVKKNSYWEAQFYINNPASDWSKPEALWPMHKETKFLDEVAGQLLDVVRISEPIVDGLVQKK